MLQGGLSFLNSLQLAGQGYKVSIPAGLQETGHLGFTQGKAARTQGSARGGGGGCSFSSEHRFFLVPKQSVPRGPLSGSVERDALFTCLSPHFFNVQTEPQIETHGIFLWGQNSLFCDVLGLCVS